MYYYADKNERLRNDNATIVPFATFFDIELFPDKKNGRRFDLLTKPTPGSEKVYKYELLATSARDAYNWYQLLRFFLPRAHEAALRIQRVYAAFKDKAHGKRMIQTLKLALAKQLKEEEARLAKEAKRDAARAASSARTGAKTSAKMGRLAKLRAKKEAKVKAIKTAKAKELNMSIDSYDAHVAGAEACGMAVEEYVGAQAGALGMSVAAYGACAEAAAQEGVSPEDHVQVRCSFLLFVDSFVLIYFFVYSSISFLTTSSPAPTAPGWTSSRTPRTSRTQRRLG